MPPRPAKATAAGVLLVLVGLDAFLAGVGLVTVLLLVAAASDVGPCLAVGLGAGCATPAIGIMMIRHGVAILSGQLRNPVAVLNVYVLLGLSSFGAIGAVVLRGPIRLPNALPEAAVAGGMLLFAVLNLAALMTAGTLLATARRQYDEWRESLPPAEPDNFPET